MVGLAVSNPEEPSVWSSHVLCVCVVSLGAPAVSPQSKHMPVRLIGNSKLPACEWLLVFMCQPCDELVTNPSA